MVPQRRVGQVVRRRLMRDVTNLAGVVVGIGFAAPLEGGVSVGGQAPGSAAWAEVVGASNEARLGDGGRERHQHSGSESICEEV